MRPAAWAPGTRLAAGQVRTHRSPVDGIRQQPFSRGFFTGGAPQGACKRQHEQRRHSESRASILRIPCSDRSSGRINSPRVGQDHHKMSRPVAPASQAPWRQQGHPVSKSPQASHHCRSFRQQAQQPGRVRGTPCFSYGLALWLIKKTDTLITGGSTLWRTKILRSNKSSRHIGRD